jgi:hypothetical protein
VSAQQASTTPYTSISYPTPRTSSLVLSRLSLRKYSIRSALLPIPSGNLTNNHPRYYQPNPPAPAPFKVVSSLNDPDFAASCAGKPANCADSWALRIVNSQDILLYGAGFYSFFNNYVGSKSLPPCPSLFPISPRISVSTTPTPNPH